MKIKDLFIKQVALEDDFNYKVLYNDNRGAVFKDDYKALINEAISKKLITVEKFIVAENIQDDLYQISDTKGIEYTLLNLLKNYHNEPDYLIAPFIYILKKLDNDFTLCDKQGRLKIVSNSFEVEICPRIDGKNAEPRLFFTKKKIAIASTNDNIENLGDILAVKDIKVFIIGTDNRSKDVYAYKISRDDSYFDVAEGYKNNLRAELFDRIGKYDR